MTVITGKKVIHGKVPFDLTITKRDILKGKSKDPAACAASVAIMRENSDIKSVRVHVGRIFVETATHWIRYKTPATLRNEIVAFDRGGEFLPGTHQVKVLTKAEQRYIDDKEWRAQKRAERDYREEKNGRKKKITHIVPGVRARGSSR